jgi:drug/metabolite transporter (DMT)-like permease
VGKRSAPAQRQGIVFAILSTVFFTGSDALIKLLVLATPFLLVLCLRYVFQAVVISLWILAKPQAGRVHFDHGRLHLLRCAMLIISSCCGYWALGKVPLALYTTLMMSAPLMALVLGRVILHEKVSTYQWVCVAAGAAGMLLIVRPAGESWNPDSLWVLGSAFFGAGFHISSRSLMIKVDVLWANWVSSVSIALVSGAAVAWIAWTSPGHAYRLSDLSASWWGAMLAMCSLATAGQISLASALQKSPLALTAPYSYFQILFATLMGVAVFKHVPHVFDVAGMALIAASGIFLAWRTSFR